jgi:hypothetical protein
MGSASNTSVFALAGALAALIFWALGNIIPDVPPGIEAAATTVIATVIAWFAPADLLSKIPKRAGPTVLALGLVGSTGCVTVQPYDAISAAETLEQRTFALYGTFVWAQGVAADVVEDPDVPDVVAKPIGEAVLAARPPVRAAFELAISAADIRRELKGGADVGDKLAAVLEDLAQAYTRAEPHVRFLVSLIGG